METDQQEQDVFDPRVYDQVVRASLPFDGYAKRALPDPNRIPCLVGRELQQLAVWIVKQKTVAIAGDMGGRRSSDVAAKGRLVEQEDELSALRSRLEYLEMQRAGDRRKHQIPIAHRDRRFLP